MSDPGAVRVERTGAVWTVLLSRPERRNAVDRATAEAFRAFDADQTAAVAVLHGEGGVFCSGADLTAIGTERGNRVAPDGDGPMGLSRLRLSMDMILTGRAVDAAEAEAIGLANRLVPAGQALPGARELAAELASFPQICLRGDRASVLAQQGLDETAAMAAEFAFGQEALTAEALAGAARFAAGAGRHGGKAN